MASVKVSEVVKCKTVEELEEFDVSVKTWEKVKDMLESKKPKGYAQSIKLIDKMLLANIEDEEVIEDEEPAKKKGGKKTAGKSSRGGASSKKPRKEEEEEFELFGETYVPTVLDRKAFEKAMYPPKNVLVLIDEGEEEATVLTPVWVGDTSITLIDLSRHKDLPLEINTKDFFKGNIESPVDGFEGELVGCLIKR